MPTQEEEESLEGAATSIPGTVSGGSAADTTGAADRDSAVHRTDTLGIGQETRTAVSVPLVADTTGQGTKPTTICNGRETGNSSITVATALMRAEESERATVAAPAWPTGIRRRPIAHRTQVSSAANLAESLPGGARADLFSLAKTLRTPTEKLRTRVASILEASTRPSALAVTVRAASTWEAAGTRRRASVAAGRISGEDTRTAVEVTPAGTAAASITTEAGAGDRSRRSTLRHGDDSNDAQRTARTADDLQRCREPVPTLINFLPTGAIVIEDSKESCCAREKMGTKTARIIWNGIELPNDDASKALLQVADLVANGLGSYS